MEIIAYTSQGCYYCDQLHELFKRADVKYKSILVLENNATPGAHTHSNNPKYSMDNVMSRTDFAEKFPGINGFPYVIIDGKPIGALIETAKFLVKEGLVSAKKR